MRAFLCMLALSTSLFADQAEFPAFKPVGKVDINRFMGTWYVIARLEFPWDRGCFHNPVVTYTRNGDGTIQVVNQCQTDNFFHSIQKAEGTAELLDQSHAKWKIAYKEHYKGLPEGEFWIIALADDYSYAAASDPSQENLWIYTRSPHVSQAVYQKILDKVVMMMPNINVLNVLPTKQDP